MPQVSRCDIAIQALRRERTRHARLEQVWGTHSDDRRGLYHRAELRLGRRRHPLTALVPLLSLLALLGSACGGDESEAAGHEASGSAVCSVVGLGSGWPLYLLAAGFLVNVVRRNPSVPRKYYFLMPVVSLPILPTVWISC